MPDKKPSKRKDKLASLKGIWKGKGFEKIDAEKELRTVRSEILMRLIEKFS